MEGTKKAYFLVSSESSVELKILEETFEKNNQVKIVESISLFFKPITSSYMNGVFYFLTENKHIGYCYKNKRIFNLILPMFKYSKLVFISDYEMVYIFENEIGEQKIGYELHKGNCKKYFEFIKLEELYKVVKKYSSDSKKILKSLKKEKTTLENIKIKIEDIYSSIIIRDVNVSIKKFGTITRFVELDCTVLYMISSFFSPTKIVSINIASLNELVIFDTESDEVSVSLKLNNIEANIRHHLNPVPHYCVKGENNEKACIFVHGGPFYRYRNEYIYFAHQMYLQNYDVILINYTGSSGYSLEYSKKLFKNGGVYDLRDLELIVEKIKKRYSKLVIIGESYGGYLVMLYYYYILSVGHTKMKCISINGFVDLKIQYYLSSSYPVIERYFDWESPRHDLYSKARLKSESNFSKSDLILINGIKDFSIPIIQIKKLKECDPSIITYFINRGHFITEYRSDILKLILQSLKEE